MPPKSTVAYKYIDLLIRGENIANATYVRKGHCTPQPSTEELFNAYAKWYTDVKSYFDVLGPESSNFFYSYELTHIPAVFDARVYYNFTQKQLSDEVRKLRRDVNALKKIMRESREDIKEAEVSNALVTIKRGGYAFSFNTVTGEVTLNGYRTIFPVGQKKYVALKCIVTGPSNKGTYNVLYEELGLTIHPEKERRVQDIIREVKIGLSILPKSKASNPDIIENAPSDGYFLK